MYEEYKELVRLLKDKAEGFDYDGWVDTALVMEKAAKAIEELIRRNTPMKITEIHVDEYYCPACGAENNCDQGNVQDAYCPVCGQRLLPQPPKEKT